MHIGLVVPDFLKSFRIISKNNNILYMSNYNRDLGFWLLVIYLGVQNLIGAKHYDWFNC